MTVYVIFRTANSQKQFLSNYTIRTVDSMLIPEHCNSESAAMKFISHSLAEQTLAKLINHYDFKYDIEPLEIDG